MIYWIIAAILWPVFVYIAYKFVNKEMPYDGTFLSFACIAYFVVIMPIVFAAGWPVILFVAAPFGLVYGAWRAFERPIKIN